MPIALCSAVLQPFNRIEHFEGNGCGSELLARRCRQAGLYFARCHDCSNTPLSAGLSATEASLTACRALLYYSITASLLFDPGDPGDPGERNPQPCMSMSHVSRSLRSRSSLWPVLASSSSRSPHLWHARLLPNEAYGAEDLRV